MLVPRFAWTTRADGDHAGDLSVRHPDWTWLRQVHGDRVVLVTHPGEHAGAAADAAVTSSPGCTLAVRTADCVPIVLVGERAIGVVHAGWRGLVGGVVERAVEALVALGGPPVSAHLGPCIRVGCYEFDGSEREQVADRYGPGALGVTTNGTPALDLAATAIAALRGAGVAVVHDTSGCTACDSRWYSYRARGEPERIATVAWLEQA